MKREKFELSYHARMLHARLLRGAKLRAQTATTEEDIAKGGLMFWLDPPGKKCGAAGARELIAKGIVTPLNDGLFADQSQSWELAQQ